MTLSLIVAMTEDRVIGKNNQLPWHISDDLRRFKQLTMGHPIIMGRKTYESIGRPLPGRQNIVVTHNPKYEAEGMTIVHSFTDALSKAEKDNPEIFVIGGAALFKEALPQVDRIYLTKVHHPFQGDIYFPDFNLDTDFKVKEKSVHQNPGDPPFSYSFIVAEKKTANV